jgi:hypothetical protein
MSSEGSQSLLFRWFWKSWTWGGASPFSGMMHDDCLQLANASNHGAIAPSSVIVSRSANSTKPKSWAPRRPQAVAVSTNRMTSEQVHKSKGPKLLWHFDRFPIPSPKTPQWI